MATTQWPPFGAVWSEMKRLQEETEQRLGRHGTDAPRPSAPNVDPPLNVWEDDNNLYVEAEFPELDLDDLEILVNGDNQLSIQGERKRPEQEAGMWRHRERSHGGFSRTGELPQYVDSDKVTAELQYGVLTITLPKRQEVKARRIEVKAG